MLEHNNVAVGVWEVFLPDLDHRETERGTELIMSVQAAEVVTEERVIVSTKKESTKRKTTSTAVDDLTSEEREAVTIVFHQFETGLREGTIFTKVKATEKDS